MTFGFLKALQRVRDLVNNRWPVASLVIGAALAPVVALGITLSAPPPQVAATASLCYSTKRVLTASDITYLGAIRMPPGTDTTFAYGGLTGRMVNGQVHLFVYGNHLGSVGGVIDPVYEIADPGTYNTNYQAAPYAALVTTWGDVYHGKRETWDSNGNPIAMQYVYPASLYWSDSTQLLYWTYHDTYNVTGRPDWNIGASSLGSPANAASTSYGPWRTVATDADGQIHYGPWRCLYPFPNPTDGTMLCGSSIQSGNVGSPWGPDAYGGANWPTTSTLRIGTSSTTSWVTASPPTT
jgi:hypothetical protein